MRLITLTVLWALYFLAFMLFLLWLWNSMGMPVSMAYVWFGVKIALGILALIGFLFALMAFDDGRKTRGEL